MATPPEFAFAILVLDRLFCDPAGMPNIGIDSRSLAIANPGWEKTVALLLRKVQKPLHHFRPEPIGNEPVGRWL